MSFSFFGSSPSSPGGHSSSPTSSQNSSTSSTPAGRTKTKRREGRGGGWPQLGGFPSPGTSPLLNFSVMRMGMAKAAEELMDRLHLGHSALRSLRAALLAGDEAKALEEYTAIDKNGKCLAEEMYPSALFKVSKRHGESTALHLAAHAAMVDVLTMFLSRGADLSIRTSRKETAVHCVCQRADRPEERVACLKALLSWVGPEIDGVTERASVNSVDATGCTAAHHAASKGMLSLVKVLVEYGANLTIVNTEQETASDTAAAHGHKGLADWLEARVMFAETELTSQGALLAVQAAGTETGNREAAQQQQHGSHDDYDFVSLDWGQVEARREEALALAAEELAQQQGKAEGGWSKSRAGADELLECLLHECRWSQSQLSRALASTRGGDGSSSSSATQHGGPSPPEVTKRCRVDDYYAAGWLGAFSASASSPPPAAESSEEADSDGHMPKSDSSAQAAAGVAGQGDDNSCHKCPICQEVVERPDTMELSPCKHSFCPTCLKDYAEYQIREGNSELLRCPEFSCQTLVPESTLGSVGVSHDMLERYQQSRTRAFVERAGFLSYCPAANCSWVVEKRRTKDITASSGLSGAPREPGVKGMKDGGGGGGDEERKEEEEEEEGLEARCRDGHSFCWHCKAQEPHFPCSCEAWRAWTEVVAKETVKALEDVKKKAALMGGESGLAGAEAEAELLANILWLSANTKECPKCGTPIEKTSGCNHMACASRTCRFEFCWICKEAWELHSNKTGGFFRCNRFLETAGPPLLPGGTTAGLEGDASTSGGADQSAASSSTSSDSGAVAEAGGGGGGGHDGGGGGDEEAAMGEDSDQQRQNVLHAQKGSAIQEAKRMAEQSRRMARFIHHYTRFQAHKDSSKLEKMQHVETRRRVQECLSIWLARDKEEEGGAGPAVPAGQVGTSHSMISINKQETTAATGTDITGPPERPLPSSVGSGSDAGPDLLANDDDKIDVSFLDRAFEELACGRLTLRNSYAFAFFELANPPSRDLQGFVPEDSKLLRDGERNSSRRTSAKKHVFERHQSELEMMVETLSGLIDPPRRRLHASKSEITAHAAAVRRKRVEFEKVMMCRGRGLDALMADRDFSSPSPGARRSSRSRSGKAREGGTQRHRGGSRAADSFDHLGNRIPGSNRHHHHHHYHRHQQEEGEGDDTDASLLNDILSNMDVAGVDDLEVAMMDRAILMSLLPPESSSLPSSSSTTGDLEPRSSSSSAAAAAAALSSSLGAVSPALSQLYGDDGSRNRSASWAPGERSSRHSSSRWQDMAHLDDEEDEDGGDSFTCRACTLIQQGGATCELCGTAREPGNYFHPGRRP